MLRSLLASLLIFMSSPSRSEPMCVFVSSVVEAEGSIRRLRGRELDGFLRWFNDREPKTDYDGPVWVFDIESQGVLQVGVLASDQIACFIDITGDARVGALASMREI